MAARVMDRIATDAVICDGCLSDGRLSGYCSMCQIRVCAVERGVANCARCADYALASHGCDKLDAFFQHAPEARALLDQLAAGLT